MAHNSIREADYETLIKFADYFDVTLDEPLERDYLPGSSKKGTAADN